MTAKGDQRKTASERMMRGWCVCQASGGGYELIEVLIPRRIAEAHATSRHPRDMRSIVAAKIAQRIETSELP